MLNTSDTVASAPNGVQGAVPPKPQGYPRDVAEGSAFVTIYCERWEQHQGPKRITKYRFKLRWWVGEEEMILIVHDEDKAIFQAKAKARELNAENRPPSKEVYEVVQQKALKYDICAGYLEGTGVTPVEACLEYGKLHNRMGPSQLEALMHVEAPRYEKVKPIICGELVDWNRTIIVGTIPLVDAKPSGTKHQKRQGVILDKFKRTFEKVPMMALSAKEVEQFLEDEFEGADSFNKALGCLRELFTRVRDFDLALKCDAPTVCDQIHTREVKHTKGEVLAVGLLIRLLHLCFDQECVLALFLVTHNFCRQEEVEKLLGEHFLRDAAGLPYEIRIPAEVSKTKELRSIPIEPEHRELLKLLVPPAGPLFQFKGPFRRIQSLAKRFKIALPINCFRHSCVSYMVAAGMTPEVAQKRAGHDEDNQERHYLIAVPQPEGQRYRAIRFDVDWIRGLPRAVRRAPDGAKSGTEAAASSTDSTVGSP